MLVLSHEYLFYNGCHSSRKPIESVFPNYVNWELETGVFSCNTHHSAGKQRGFLTVFYFYWTQYILKYNENFFFVKRYTSFLKSKPI